MRPDSLPPTKQKGLEEKLTKKSGPLAEESVENGIFVFRSQRIELTGLFDSVGIDLFD